MKLRNKRTGEIVDLSEGFIKDTYNGEMIQIKPVAISNKEGYVYGSLTELNEEWEDYEEPKDGWCIDYYDAVKVGPKYDALIKEAKLIGNYFETKEEAEKALEKLKALARLKQYGFRFIDWELDIKTVADGKIWFDIGTNTEWDAERLLEIKPEAKKSLDLLFGGEE